MAHNLVDAICSGELDLARDILQRGLYGNIDSLHDNRPGTALFCCCIRGYLSLASLLLERRADVDSKNENLATPLHGAVDNGHTDLVRLLLSFKADVNAQTRRGDSPLHLAAYRGFPHISKCLVLAGADLTLVNTASMTPEMEARGQGHSSLAIYLRAVHEVIYPSGETGGRHRCDSLVTLDPPQLDGLDCEDQRLGLLQRDQQTTLQHGPQLALPPNSQHGASPWQPGLTSAESAAMRVHALENLFEPRHIAQNDEQLNECSCCTKRPLREHQLNGNRRNVCGHRLDYGSSREMGLVSLDSLHNDRQPQWKNQQPPQQSIQPPQQQHYRHSLHQYDVDRTPIPQHFHQREQNQPKSLVRHSSYQKQQQPMFPVMVGRRPNSHPQFCSSLVQLDSVTSSSLPQFIPAVLVSPQTSSNTTATHQPYNTATHQAYNTATHQAHNTATHQAHNTATHQAHNTATRQAHNTATHQAHNTATHQAHNTATHQAYNTATHQAHNTAKHQAHNTATHLPHTTSDYQRQNMLRPEIITFNDQFVNHPSPASLAYLDRSLPSSWGSGSDFSRGGTTDRQGSSASSLVHTSVAGMVLSEDDEEEGEGVYINSGRSPPDSASYASLSPSTHRPPRLSSATKVLRSKSLNCHPPHSRDTAGEDSTRRELKNTKDVNSLSSRKLNLLRDYVPVGPPPLPSDSLEVQHSPALSSLGSGMASCGSATSILEAKRFKPPARLSRSASSSPSVGLEDSSSNICKKFLRDSESLSGPVNRWGVQPHCQPMSFSPGISNLPGLPVFRRCSVDDALKSNLEHGYTGAVGGGCRRFSVAGINSVNSPSNIDSSSNSRSNSSIVGSISSITSGSDNVRRNNSCSESAYGSSETSLVSSASDSCGYVHSGDNISDSATDLSCDRELDSGHRAWQDLALLPPPLASRPDTDTETGGKVDTAVPSSPSLSRLPPPPREITRFHSLPNYSTVGNNDNCSSSNFSSTNINNNNNNNTNDNSDVRSKISNRFSQLNDLSVSATQNLSSSPGKSTLFDTHQSMPPMMTCVNIPIN